MMVKSASAVAAMLAVPILNLDFPCPLTPTLQNLYTADTIVGNFQATDYSRFRCGPSGHGISPTDRVSLYASANNLKTLYKEMDFGFAIEFWITPDVTPHYNKTLLTFGEGVKDGRYGDSYLRCEDFDFRIYIDDRTLKIQYTSFHKCNTLALDGFRLDSKLTHVVVTNEPYP